MSSKTDGKSISKAVEVTNISSHGVWVILHEVEYYLSFSNFPWFKEAKISDITNVKLLNGKHLFWPELDVDLDIDSIKNIEKYPLVYK